MNEHCEYMSRERLSALLDEPLEDGDGRRHLDACAECQAEFEALSRMRMALSALPDVKPPPGAWARIEAGLPARRPRREPGFLARRFAGGLPIPVPVQAAAALVLFAGGVVAGLQFTGGGGSPTERAALPVVVSESDDRALVDALNQLESVRTPLVQVGASAVGGTVGGGDNPLRAGLSGDDLGAVESLARLDGFLQALRERLDASPEDPAANAYLLEALELRDQLADALARQRGTRTW